MSQRYESSREFDVVTFEGVTRGGVHQVIVHGTRDRWGRICVRVEEGTYDSKDDAVLAAAFAQSHYDCPEGHGVQ